MGKFSREDSGLVYIGSAALAVMLSEVCPVTQSLDLKYGLYHTAQLMRQALFGFA
jgi:hypothetical protein